ncbi:MAG: alpha/beta fold hydrolase [Myxococcota bacterium]
MFEELSAKEGFFENRRGMRIAYQECGEGPPVILTNGIGGRWQAWYFVIKHFHSRFRFISWDYRGMYKSEPPEDPEAVTVAHQCEDLKDMLDHFDIKEAIFIGWSMGVQVNFEFYRYFPEMMRAIIVFDGAYGLPFETALNLPFSTRILKAFFSFVEKKSELSEEFMGLFYKLPFLFDAVKLIGLIAPSCSREIFVEMAGGFKYMNMDMMAKTMQKLAVHDAYDVLSAIRVPVMIIIGSKDLMTPVTIARQMEQQIPDATLHIIEGGTHYTPVEFPEDVNRFLEEFIERYKLNNKE